MTKTIVDNYYYHIGIDKENNRIYFILKTAETDKETDQNITNNFLSNAYGLDKGFNLVLDVRSYDLRLKGPKFGKRLRDMAIRLNELDAGPQAHVLSPMHWQAVYNNYPEHEGENPMIITDPYTDKLIGRFDTVEEAENWLSSL